MRAYTATRTRQPRPIALLAVTVAALACLTSLAFASRADAFIYWSVGGRADLDGSNVLTDFVAPDSIGIATDGSHFYWSAGNRIGRADLPSGSSADPAFITPVRAGEMAVDGDHLYWTSRETNTIGRADLDGSNVDQRFISTVVPPHGIAVGGGHIYWTAGDGDSDGDPYTDHNRTIGRADLDGSNVDPDFIDPPTTFPHVVAVNGTHIFWAAVAGFPGDRIARANLDGTGVDESLITGVEPSGLAVDAAHIYWGSVNGFNFGSIGRANLDGSNVDQSFISGSSYLLPFIPIDVAVDSVACATADCISPSLSIDSSPPEFTNDNSPLLSFHATDANGPVTFQCEFSGPKSGSGACSSPYDFLGGGLADGKYRAVVTATDAVGNNKRADIQFTVDTVAPVTVIDSAPSGVTTDNTPSVSFHAIDANMGHFNCQVDSRPISPCISPMTFGPLADGPHTITVIAIDAAWNFETVAKTARFTVSSVPPPGTTSLPPGAGPSATATHPRKKCMKKYPTSIKKRKQCLKKLKNRRRAEA